MPHQPSPNCYEREVDWDLLRRLAVHSGVDVWYLRIYLTQRTNRMVFRKSTTPQKRQASVSISNSKQQVDELEGELTF